MKTKPETNRRTFLASCGAAVAVAAVTTTPAARDWSRSRELLATLRSAYAAEVERLAEMLRPRFEAGELCGFTRDESGGAEALTRACAAHFGLEVKDPCGTCEGDASMAHLILAASPSRDLNQTHFAGVAYDHPAQEAEDTAIFDVLAVATERGWHTPARGEVPRRAELAGIWAALDSARRAA